MVSLLKLRPLLFVCFISLLISGCGFHLRGSSPLPAHLKSLSLDWQSADSPFRQQMEKSLQRAGVSLAEEATAAQLNLHLRHQRLAKRPISFAGNGLVAQYELAQQLEFQVGTHSPTSDWQTIKVTRQYDYLPNNVTANQAQERQLNQNMQRDLIQQLLRRLQFAQINTSTPTANKPSKTTESVE